MPQIVLSSRVFNYHLIRKSKGTISLKLISPDSFQVSAPTLLPQFFITQFIQSKSNWIAKYSAKISPSPQVISLTQLTILDVPYNLIIRQSDHDSVVIFESNHQIYLNATSLINNHLQQILDKKLRTLSLRLIKTNLTQLSDQYHFEYHHVSVRNQRSRFGSCSGTNNLNFNWQLILLPFPIFRHVLLHELTHTLIKNHTLRFWHQLSLYDPDFRTHRLWLKKNAPKYFIISP